MAQKRTHSSLSSREKVAYGLAFAAMAVFVVLGIYLLYHPSDALSDVYAVALLITLGIGVLSGVVVALGD